MREAPSSGAWRGNIMRGGESVTAEGVVSCIGNIPAYKLSTWETGREGKAGVTAGVTRI